MIKRRGKNNNKPMMWCSWDSLRAKSVHYTVIEDAHSGEIARFIELHGDSNVISCLHALYFVSPSEFLFVFFWTDVVSCSDEHVKHLPATKMFHLFIYFLFIFSIFDLSAGDKQRLEESNIKTRWQGFVTGVRRMSTASW